MFLDEFAKLRKSNYRIFDR